LERDAKDEDLKDEILPKEVVEHFNEQMRKNAEWKQKYGEVRPIIHTDFDDKKIVAVHNKLYYSNRWRTFPDFLVNYAQGVLGSEWGNSELKKTLRERHQIMKWYDGMCYDQREHFIKDDDGLYSYLPNGDSQAFLHLAYDLYILRHHNSLQQRIILRIKDKNQFQGARYELFAAACCIRAGYDLEYEDETDVTRKHPEFIATCRATGQKIHVEAKSRHRPGILGFPGDKTEEEVTAGITRLLNNALAKVRDYPYIIFIDLNMPPITEEMVTKLQVELTETVDLLCENGEKDRFNLILFTNHPHPYGDKNEPDPAGTTMMVYSENSINIPEDPDAILSLFKAAEQYSNIPNLFPD
jgi:hypothetical protein